MTSTSILILISCLLVARQPSKQRMVIAGAFSLSCAAYAIFRHYIPDELYYLVACMIDITILGGICYFAKQTRFTDYMFGICFLSFILNIFGLVLYENCNNGLSYKIAFDMLYFTVICIYMTKGKGNGNQNTNLFRLPYRKRNNLCNSLYKKA